MPTSGTAAPGTYDDGNGTHTTVVGATPAAAPKASGGVQTNATRDPVAVNGTACQLTSGAGANSNSCPSNSAVTIGMSGGTVYRALVQVSVANSLPPDAAIVSAGFNLLTPSSRPQPIQAYAVTQSWTPASVTWNSASSGTAWSTAGGSYDSTTAAFKGPSYVLTPSASSDGINLSALVSSLLKTPSTNNGVILRQVDESIAATVQLSYTPQLAVVWSRRQATDPAGSPLTLKASDQVSVAVNRANLNLTVQGNLVSLPG